MNWIKKLLPMFLAFFLVMTPTHDVFAGTSHQRFVYTSLVDSPVHEMIPYVVKHGQVYIAIWYVGNIWDGVGGISQWDGNTKSWRIQPSTGPEMPPGPSLLINQQIGTGSIYVNKKLVGVHIPVVVGIDPLSHHETAYMPMYTVMQILGFMHWNTVD